MGRTRKRDPRRLRQRVSEFLNTLLLSLLLLLQPPQVGRSALSVSVRGMTTVLCSRVNAVSRDRRRVRSLRPGPSRVPPPYGDPDGRGRDLSSGDLYPQVYRRVRRDLSTVVRVRCSQEKGVGTTVVAVDGRVGPSVTGPDRLLSTTVGRAVGRVRGEGSCLPTPLHVVYCPFTLIFGDGCGTGTYKCRRVRGTSFDCVQSLPNTS